MTLFFFQRRGPAAWSGADVSGYLLFQCVEHLGADFRDIAIRRFRSRECRPAALLDKRVLFPRVDRLEFDQSGFGLGGTLELIDADWRERRDDRAVGALSRHFHGRAS